MESIAFALIFIAFIAAGFFVWYFSFKAKQEERRFLIEKGYKLEELPPSASFKFQFPWLKVGMVVTFAMIGFFMGVITQERMVVMPALIFGAGLGMILAQAVDTGYKIRLWRKLIFGLLGLGLGGLISSVLVYNLSFDSDIAVFALIFSFALALLIEIRTQKSTEPGE